MGAPKGIDWDSVPLGELADRQIAMQLDVHPQAVGHARRKRGISPYKGPPSPRKQDEAIEISENDLHWLTGLLEGEGYFGLVPSKNSGHTYHYARIGVTMTDKDVIERAALVMGARRIRGPYLNKNAPGPRKPQWRAVVQGYRALALMRLLHPHLGLRRRAQVDLVLAYEDSRPDPNVSRREWSAAAVKGRPRDEKGRLLPKGQMTCEQENG